MGGGAFAWDCGRYTPVPKAPPPIRQIIEAVEAAQSKKVSEMIDTLASPLPPLYASWVEALLGDSIPPETRAICQDCVMCEEGADHQAPDSLLFNPKTKCIY
jgi:hypothetical protein